MQAYISPSKIAVRIRAARSAPKALYFADPVYLHIPYNS